MKLWNSEEELLQIVERELSTCLVGDGMDKMQMVHQFLSPQVRPLRPEMMLIGIWILRPGFRTPPQSI